MYSTLRTWLADHEGGPGWAPGGPERCDSGSGAGRRPRKPLWMSSTAELLRAALAQLLEATPAVDEAEEGRALCNDILAALLRCSPPAHPKRTTAAQPPLLLELPAALPTGGPPKRGHREKTRGRTAPSPQEVVGKTSPNESAGLVVAGV